MKNLFWLTVALLLQGSALAAQARPTMGTLSGTVSSDEGSPLNDASVRVTRSGDTTSYGTVTDVRGTFSIGGLPPGLYRLAARRIGFREAGLSAIRVIAGRTTQVTVRLTRSPTQLSTVTIQVTPTSIDATTTELSRRIQVQDVQLLPLGRDAASLVELVPGARKGFIWGAGGDAANNYQLDGVAVNHPGTGGDFLAPGIDWIEALEVRGLGAGAEHGGFQGGIVNAITKSGSNEFQGGFRVNHIAPSFTSSNIKANEEGAEQSARSEVSGELRGPLVRDRLFYFITAQVVDRDIRVPDLTTAADRDFRSELRELRDARGLAKLTFLPSLGNRVDALLGFSNSTAERADLNGLDDPSASRRISAPTAFYSLGWAGSSASDAFEFKIAGFSASETRNGYATATVPGIQVYRIGRQPVYQNSVFNELLEPRTLGASAKWERRRSVGRGENRLVLGGDYTIASWKHQRLRNGGMTWRPYLNPSTQSIDPADPATWPEIANEWGGEINLDTDVRDLALFVQDYFTPFAGFTINPGVRWGQWSGLVTPNYANPQRFLAVNDQGWDPRLGIVWDVSGKNELVLKAHWGRYHQGMSSLFFDRAEGANAYSSQRFYFQGPTITDPTQTFTTAQRDAMTAATQFGSACAFPPCFAETIMNEAGRVENYRQPYVDQWVLGLEKTFGPRWKADIVYTNRANRDVAGLVDLNLADNYSPLTNVSVRHRITFTPVGDQNGNELILPVVWVSNAALRAELLRRQALMGPLQRPVPGYSFSDIPNLSYDRDIVLTTIPGAKRDFSQLSVSLRTEQASWNGMLSVTATRLEGNVPGLTGFADVTSFNAGFGSGVASFTAGPAVRPNEGINGEGRLPNVSWFESKLWLGTRLPFGFKGGTFATFALGEYYTPTFELTPRFRFVASDLTALGDGLFQDALGQTILLEQRGDRKYEARTNLDLRLERAFLLRGAEWAITADIFNVMGSDAIIARNLTVNDQVSDDPTSQFSAPRLRVPPRSFRLGTQVTF